MMDQTTLISFDKVFPKLKDSKKLSNSEAIELANKVAKALQKESEQLEEERQQPDPPSTRFFY